MSAKIDMNSSHTVIVRLVRVIAVPPAAAPSTLAPSAAVRATAMPPASVPPTRPPETTPTPVRTLTPVPTASTDTNNLPALLPTLADIAPGAIIGGEGYVEDTDALLTYEREFEAEGLFFTLGLSQLSNLSSTVEMYATSSDASAPVLVMRAMDPQLFAQLAGPAFAEGAGFSSENVVVEAIDLPAIGDATAGFLMRVQSAAINLDVYMLWFAQGRIAAQLIAGGLRGQIHLDDVARIARLIDQRIIQRIDDNPPRTPLATPTPTRTPSATRVPMPTLVHFATSTPTTTPTPTPTLAPAATATPTPRPVPTQVPTPTATPTPPTPTPVPPTPTPLPPTPTPTPESGPLVPGFTVTVFAPEITDPTGITVDPNGNIYTINRVGGIATMFGPAGNVIKSVALGGVDLIDIYFDPMTGELFVGGWVSQSVGHIYRFDINGGGSKTLIATLAGISGITGDTSGNIYAAQVNAGIVSKITPSGDVTTYATGLNNPDGIAFDPAGRLYAGSRTGQVMVAPIGGGAATNFATLTGAIMDLVTDGAGNVYATNADPTQGTITKITPGGSVSSFGTGFGGPQGIVFDASGNLFIANLNSDVIYKVAGVG